MTARPLALTQDTFSESYVQIGSGTCLQPLLRYSDRVRGFVFVDYSLDGRVFLENLQASERALRRAAAELEEPRPLWLEDIEYRDDLTMGDFELALPPSQSIARLQSVFQPRALERYMHLFAPRSSDVRQWGLTAQVVRSIPQISGPPIQRRRPLRVFGGEGLLTYIAMGGLSRPPPIVATIQTGVLEHAHSPLARLLQAQARQGGALPQAWVRGKLWRPGAAWTPLSPVQPFSIIGQAYTGWVTDRTWPRAPWRHRSVQAWVQEESPQDTLSLGPHRIVRRWLTLEDVDKHDASSMPRRVAERLGVAERPSVHLHTARQAGPLRRSMAAHLQQWLARGELKHARHALLVPSGMEDELEVLIAALRTLPSPAITVYLPLTMDFESAQRCISGPAPVRPAPPAG